MYESVAVLAPFTPSAEEAYVPMSVAPVPNSSVARWKRSVNPAPVETELLFVMVLERVMAVPAVAFAGDVGDAVRSGRALTVTFAWAVPEPALLVHVSV